MKTFLVVTEKGRIRGRISGAIYQMVDNKPVLLVGDYNYSAGSNPGDVAMAARKLVEEKHLPESCLDAGGYLTDAADARMVMVEGSGLTYCTVKEYTK
jgi:hypothetical protein